MKSMVYVRSFPGDQVDRLNEETLFSNLPPLLRAYSKEMGSADALSDPFCEKNRSIWSSKKTAGFDDCFSGRDGCRVGQGRRTLQVRMRPAPVVALPSTIGPSVSGKRFQNFGEATGTIPFARHQIE